MHLQEEGGSERAEEERGANDESGRAEGGGFVALKETINPDFEFAVTSIHRSLFNFDYLEAFLAQSAERQSHT